MFPFLIFLFQIITVEVGAFKSQLYPIIYSAVGDQRKKSETWFPFDSTSLNDLLILSLSLSLSISVCVYVCVWVS